MSAQGFTHLVCDRCGRERPYLGTMTLMYPSACKTELLSEARRNAGWQTGKRILCAGCSTAVGRKRKELEKLPRHNSDELYPKERPTKKFEDYYFGYTKFSKRIDQ